MDLVSKIFSVFPDEAALIREANFGELEILPPRAAEAFDDQTEEKRPIRCRIPKVLKTLLKDISKEKCIPMVTLLLAAARRYRQLHPVEREWKAPSAADLIENKDRGLSPVVYFLTDEDRELIQNLGRGVSGVMRRREAFQAIIPILQDMRLSMPDASKRISVRASIPLALHERILEQVAEGRSYIEVLLNACRNARRAKHQQ